MFRSCVPLRHVKQTLAAILVFGSLSLVSFDAISSSFISANGRHPINALFGLPAPRTLQFYPDRQARKLHFAVSLDHSNIFSGGVEGEERLLMDGESTRLSVYSAKRISRCTALGVELPFTAHSPGKLDDFIETWHDIFQLPDARRSLTEQNLLNYNYTLNEGATGSQSIEVDQARQGIGDVSAHVEFHLGCSGSKSRTDDVLSNLRSAGSLRAGIKLPTGSLNDLTGSETTDLFIEYAGSSLSLLSRRTSSLDGRGRLGLLLPGSSSFFSNLKPLVLYGSGLLEWRPSGHAANRSSGYQLRNLALQLQLDWHSPLFDSELTELGNWSAQLGVGVKWNAGARRSWKLSLLEDVVIDTSPDFVVHLGYIRGF